MQTTKSRSRYIPKHVKEAVRRRDRDVCQDCGKMSEYMEFDHITPFSKGAPSTIDNLQLLCRKCNLKKRNKSPRECSDCGKWNSHDVVYCHHCGTKQRQLVTKAKYGKSSWKKKARKIVFVFLLLDLLFLWLKFSH